MMAIIAKLTIKARSNNTGIEAFGGKTNAYNLFPDKLLKCLQSLLPGALVVGIGFLEDI